MWPPKGGVQWRALSNLSLSLLRMWERAKYPLAGSISLEAVPLFPMKRNAMHPHTLLILECHLFVSISLELLLIIWQKRVALIF